MRDKRVAAGLYSLAIVANAGLTALGVVLANGAAPVPEAWAWAVPVLVAMITAATAELPSRRELSQPPRRGRRVHQQILTWGDGPPPATLEAPAPRARRAATGRPRRRPGAGQP